MLNIELKARCEDIGRLRERLMSLGVLTLSPQRLASLPEPPEILVTGFQLDVQQNSIPHRANLPLKLSVGAQPELLPAFPARSPPGAIRLLGQDHRPADQLPRNSMKRDGDELFFHCGFSLHDESVCPTNFSVFVGR